MTFSTPVGDIKYILLGMMFLHLTFVMTVVTGVRGIVRVVAARTVAICTFVIYWERVTINLDISPGVWVMAFGALTTPMVVRSGVTGLTIR